MNNDRRKAINAAIEALEGLHSHVDQLANDEQEYYDNMHENLQGGEKGQAAEQAAQELTEAADHIRDAIDSLSSSLSA